VIEVEAGKTLLLERDQIVDLAERARISIRRSVVAISSQKSTV